MQLLLQCVNVDIFKYQIRLLLGRHSILKDSYQDQGQKKGAEKRGICICN